jgi:hypothetical protein
MKGASNQGFYGRNAEGSCSHHSFVTACCNFKSDVRGFREELATPSTSSFLENPSMLF